MAKKAVKPDTGNKKPSDKAYTRSQMSGGKAPVGRTSRLNTTSLKKLKTK